MYVYIYIYICIYIYIYIGIHVHWLASETMNDRECLSGCCSVVRTEPEWI